MKKIKWDVKRIEKEVKRLDPSVDKTSETFKTAVIMLSATITGPSVKRLLAFTKYPKADVLRVGRSCRSNGIWKGNKIDVGWFGKDGAIAFWCDNLVVDGLLKRSFAKK